MTCARTTVTSSHTAPLCPLCEDVDTYFVFHGEDELGNSFPTYSCRNCGTSFLFPPPTPAQLEKAYATSYYGEGATKFGGVIEHLRDLASKTRAQTLARGLPSNSRILDVGCGDGRLLRQFSQLGDNYQLHGIELPGPAAERTAKIPRVQLHLGTQDTVDFPEAHFDLITLVHVLEHLPNPRQAVVRLARWLKPGGILFLSFPNVDSWQAKAFGSAWFHLDPPRHLTLPSPAAVSQLLSSNKVALQRGSHWCPEQNLYGWIQSALNDLDPVRNLLYERLKRNFSYHPARKLTPLWHLLFAGLLSPFAILADATATIARSGATVELTFKKAL